jgi:nitric oxide reductase subunit B
LPANQKRPLLISKVWIQAAIIVFLIGFLILGLLAYRTYTGEPPIPGRVVDSSGSTLFTGDEVLAGQGVFLRYGLMEYGSIFGHGAYLGPDYTADYLHRAVLIVRDAYGGPASDRAQGQAAADFKINRFNEQTNTLVFTNAQRDAFEQLQTYYGGYFGDATTRNGLRPAAITDPQLIKNLTAFFAWSAWASAALRPGHDYSYTNNWPPEPLVNNHPTADAVVWSVLSLVALLGGIGLLLAAFGRWNFLGWHGREQRAIYFRPPGEVTLTPTQHSCAWFFFVMAVLFLLQALLGGASQHYRADLSSFFGIDLARILPFNIARTWHLQLAIFWVATSYLAAGIFLAPLISGREPHGQHWLSYGLLGALTIVVLGSLIGEYAGIWGLFGKYWSWLGNQGFEYLELGRLWQVLLTMGLIFWVVILLSRLARQVAKRQSRQHALAVFLRGALDSGVLFGWPACPTRFAFHHH